MISKQLQIRVQIHHSVQGGNWLKAVGIWNRESVAVSFEDDLETAWCEWASGIGC